MGFQISPGVTIVEKDASSAVPFAATTNAGFAGNFTWGPVETRVLVTSEVDLVNRFGKPDANSYVAFFTCADIFAYANNCRIVRAANTGARNATSNSAAALLIKNETVYENSYLDGSGTFGGYAARYPGELGNSIKVSTCGSANAFSLNLSSVSVTANAGAIGDTTIGTLPGANTYIVTGDYVKIGANPYIKVLSANVTGIALASALTSTVTVGSSIIRKWEYADEFDSAPGTSSYVANLLGSKDELHVIAVDATGLISGIPGTVLEKFPFVSKASDAKKEDGSTLYYPTVIFNQSRWIYWGDHDPLGTNWGNTSPSTTFTDVLKPVTETLAGGVTATVTNADLLRAWDLFKDPEAVDISLVATGDSNATVQQYIIDNILTTRKDCMGFFSPSRSNVVNNVGNETDAVIAARNSLSSTSYGFMDCGWKYRFDKYNDTYRYVPLNGDMVGLCARTDLTRDPWYSPAGYTRGQVKNVVRLAWVPNQAQRDELYKNGINPVVTFPGQGPILFGDKTLQSKPSAFDRINVRRLFIFLEKSIAIMAKYEMFEFNDEFSRATFVSAVEPFLRDVQGRRGITEYKIVCDETNNTAEVLANNAFVGAIYIVPTYSINFIQLEFTAVRTGVEFSEVVGKI